VAELARSFNRAAERIQGWSRPSAASSPSPRTSCARRSRELRVALEMLSGDAAVRAGA
jgi:hypothetical protein